MDGMKTFKFRLYPNAEQRDWMARQFGACRSIYNHFIQVRIDNYALHKDELKKRLDLPRYRPAVDPT